MDPRVEVTVSVASQSSPARGMASWGAALRSGPHARCFSGSVEPQAAVTPNAASVYAVIRAVALLRVPCLIALRSDSLYVQSSGARLNRWERAGWTKPDLEGLPRPVPNAGLWRELMDALRGGGHVMREWTPVGRHRVHEVWREGEMIHSKPVGDPVPRNGDDDRARQAAQGAMARAVARRSEIEAGASPAGPPWFPAPGQGYGE